MPSGHAAGLKINVQDDGKDPDAAAEAKAVELQKHSKLASWLEERAKFAAKNPELFSMVLESWGHRFAILMSHFAALMLSILSLSSSENSSFLITRSFRCIPYRSRVFALGVLLSRLGRRDG